MDSIQGTKALCMGLPLTRQLGIALACCLLLDRQRRFVIGNLRFQLGHRVKVSGYLTHGFHLLRLQIPVVSQHALCLLYVLL